MTDELHLQELGERKVALFCCIPDSDKSLNYLVGMIYTQLIQTLYRQADRVEVYMYASEQMIKNAEANN